MGYLRKTWLLLCLLQFTYFIFAQETQNTDSLVELLSLSRQDTARIKLFIELSVKLEKENSIQKFAYADSALILSEKLQIKKYQALAKNNKAGLYQSYKKYTEAVTEFESAKKMFNDLNNVSEISEINFQLGNIYYRLNNFQKSLYYYKISLKDREQLKDTTDIIKSEGGIAVMHWRMGNLIDAEKHYKKSLKLGETINDMDVVGASLNSLGAMHWGRGNFTKAFEYYVLALKIIEKTGNNKKYVLVINNVGLIYKEWGEFDKAMENYQDGLIMAQKEDYPYGLAYSYSNIGTILLQKNEHEKALLNFDSALINYKKISKKIGIAFSYRYIGDAYLGMKKLTKAIQYYQLSIKTAKSVDSKRHLSKAFNALAIAYFISKNYSMAKISANKSLQISINQNYQDISKDNYFLLSDLAEVLGYHAKALIYYKNASSLKDSIFNEKNSKQIAEMQTSYETEKKEQENINLKKEKQLKNAQLKASNVKIQNQYILIFAFAALLIFFITFLYLLNKSRKTLLKSKALLTKQNAEIKLQREELYAQRENLKQSYVDLQKVTDYKDKMFSIIGHDLRGPVGTISSILSLAMDDQLSEAKRQELLSLTKDSAAATFSLLENLLTWANNEQGKINFEPKNLKLYDIVKSNINLLKETASKKSIDVFVEIENNTKVFADYNMLDTIFRNLLSNAIKFSHKNGKITISAKKEPSFIKISITDTGVGMSQDTIKQIMDTEQYFSNPGTEGEKGSGLGLQLCFEFIKKNKGNCRIISEQAKGSSFIFTLPTLK